MQVDATSTAAQVPASQPNTITNNTDLNQDAFLTLMLAQLQNQDPLKPMEDKEFIAQLAQFNSLNELTQMNKTLESLLTAQSLSQGSTFIGKIVSGISIDGQSITGLASGLRFTQGSQVLEVNGSLVPVETVYVVREGVVQEAATSEDVASTEETDDGSDEQS